MKMFFNDLILTYLYDLQPQYDNAKSFYKKARIFRDDFGSIYLISYDTVVAQITDKTVTEDNKTKLQIFGWYSMTTARHINEFLQQNGFSKLSKKEMEVF